jgi:hypothetical protein
MAMTNDINHLDPNDEGLSEIFGDRWHDETKNAQHKPTAYEAKQAYNTAPKEEKTAQKVTLKPRDAEWEPAPHAPTQVEKLKECAKSALLFGGLSLLFFWFQQTEQMAMGASMCCIIACVALGAFGVGKNFAGGK